MRDEDTISTSDWPRLAHIDEATTAELVLEGAGQICPSVFTRRRRGFSGQVKEGVRSVDGGPSGFGFDCSQSLPPFQQRGFAFTLLNVLQYHIEETREEYNAITCTPGDELLFIDLKQHLVGEHWLSEKGKWSGIDRVDFCYDIIGGWIRLSQMVRRETDMMGDLVVNHGVWARYTEVVRHDAR